MAYEAKRCASHCPLTGNTPVVTASVRLHSRASNVSPVAYAAAQSSPTMYMFGSSISSSSYSLSSYSYHGCGKRSSLSLLVYVFPVWNVPPLSSTS